MMGHIIEWYYNGIAGIVPERVRYKVDVANLEITGKEVIVV